MTRLAFRLRIPLHHLVLGLALMIVVLPAVILSGQSHAASMTWDGGGTTNNWSDCANWSGDVCPGAGDTVVFNSTSAKDSVVDSGFGGTVNTVQIAIGYTGTISQARDLTVSGTFQQTGGTFTAGSQTLNLATFTQSTGAFTASSGTTNVSSTMALTGGTFNANGGTMNFNGSATHTLSCNQANFNLVTFTHTAGTIAVSGDCTMPLGANPTLGGAVNLTGALTGSGTLTANGTLSLHSNTSTKLTGFSGLVGNNFSQAGTWDFSSYSPFTFSGSFTLQSSATFTAPASMSIGGTVNIDPAATFNANGGTVSLDGGTTVSASCGNATFNLVTLDRTGGVFTIGSDCNLPLGANPTFGGAVTLNGTLSGSGTLTKISGAFTLNSGGALSGFNGLNVTALTINGTYDFSAYSSFALSGAFIAGATSTVTMPNAGANFSSDFTLSTGANFTASSGTMSVGDDFTISSGVTFNANGGTVNFNGTGGRHANCGGATFNLVTITHTSGTLVIGSDCTFPLGSNPSITSGGVIDLNGTLTGSGLLDMYVGGGTHTLDTTGALVGFTGLNVSVLTINGSYNFGSYTQFTAGGLHVNAGASFTAPSGTASFSGTFTIDPAATFNANGGTISFVDSPDGSNKTISCGNATFSLVTFPTGTGKTISNDCSLPLGNDPTVGSGAAFHLGGTFTGSGTLTVSNSFTFDPGGTISGFNNMVTQGVFSVGSGATVDFSGLHSLSVCTISCTGGFNIDGSFVAPPLITFSGDGTNWLTGGSFDPNGGTVIFNGTSQNILGDTTFYNLQKVASGDTLTFAAGSTMTVQGTLKLQGNSGGLLTLASDTPGSPWYLDAQDAASVDYLDVSDSHVLGDSIAVCDSVNGGGNIGWVFNPSSCSPEHGGSSANTAISNYTALQTYLANQQAQYSQNKTSQNQQANMSSGLPGKIQQFIQEFPNSQAITTGLTDFLKAAAAGVSLGFLVGLGWWLWIILAKRRKSDDSHILPPQATRIINPTVIQSLPTEPKDADSQHNDDTGGSS